MNLGQLLTEFYSLGFDYLNDNGAGAVRATRWLNQAYLEICDQDDWPFLETTTSGVAPLTISDLDRIESVIDTTNRLSLAQTDWRVVTADYPDLTITGPPQWYYLTGGTTLNVFPVPTSSVSVKYYKVPVELSTSTDTPVIPARFHDLIVLGAMRRGLLDDGDAGDSQQVRQEMGERLASMRMALLYRPDAQEISFGSEDW